MDKTQNQFFICGALAFLTLISPFIYFWIIS